MKWQHPIFAKQRGMTLVEVIVTLGVLSIVLMSALELYSTTLKNIRTNDSLLEILHDANQIMASLEDDIRHANEFLSDYHAGKSQLVVAALKIRKGASEGSEERVIVYALDPDRPNRLVRSVRIGDRSTSIELSTLIQELRILPTADQSFKVTLILEDEVAGKMNTLQASSVFAMR